MKKILFVLMILAPWSAILAQAKKAPAAKPATTVPAPPALKNSKDSLSYAIGLLDGAFFKQQGLGDVNQQALGKGFDDAMNGKGIMTPEAADQLVRVELQKSARRKVQPTIDAGAKFLAENAKKPGVKILPSGLQYEVIKEGDGSVRPTPTDTIVMHYTGMTIDGKKFESSLDHGQPLVYPLNRLIKGWVEGVQLMSPGAKYKLFIPYNMAYGEQGSGEAIPGGSTLIFDLELLEVRKSARQ